MTKKIILLGCISIAVGGGCAMMPTWSHTSLSGHEAQMQLAIDDGDCKVYAVNAVQMPNEPSSQTITVLGSGSTAGSGNSYLDDQRVSGQNTIRDQTIKARRAAYVGCMAKRGWQWGR